jgi:hypothetical protein
MENSQIPTKDFDTITLDFMLLAILRDYKNCLLDQILQMAHNPKILLSCGFFLTNRL